MDDLKNLIKGNVKLMFYRKGELFYQTENGFLFRVPIEDTGDGVFLNEDRAILFMRYIRKELERKKEEN